jgi:hypothetical protein
VRWVLNADSPTFDGSGTNRVMWEQMKERGMSVPGSEEPDIPEEFYVEAEKLELSDAIGWMFHIRDIFFRLSRRRTIGFASANPISLADFFSYTQLNSLNLSAFEADLIFELDDLFMSYVGEEAEKQAERKKQAQKAQQIMQAVKK